MTRREKSAWLEQGLRLFASWLFTLGLAGALCEILRLNVPLLKLLAVTLAASLALFALYNSRRLLLAVLAVGFVFGLFWAFSRDAEDWVELTAPFVWLWDWASGAGGYIEVYAEIVGVPLILACSLTCFAHFFTGSGLYFACSLHMGAFTGLLIAGHTNILPWAVPGTMALLLLYALNAPRRSAQQALTRGNALAALLVAAAVVFSAWALTPEEPYKLTDFSTRIDETIDNLFNAKNTARTRTASSLQSIGLQSGERLGGPFRPGNAPMLDVFARNGTTLLRGKSRNEYTGTSWKETTASRRFGYRQFGLEGTRARVFGLDTAQRYADFFTPQEFSITTLMPGTSTFFMPTRLEDVSIVQTALTDPDLFYNSQGELFFLDDVPAFTQYRTEALAFPGAANSRADILAMLREAAAGNDADYDAIRADYLGIPPSVEGEVYQLTHHLTDGLEPFDQALALVEFLRGGFPYTLEPPMPPEDEDFVSYFLLREPQGYCVYHASAMAIMARIANLPSRFVEGYNMPAPEPDSSRHYIVRQSNAHAWVEIYFKGFGWVPFDPTPSSSDPDEPEPTETPEPEETPPPAQPTPTRSPGVNTPAPTVEPQAPKEPFPWHIVRNIALVLLGVGLLALRVCLGRPQCYERFYRDDKQRILRYYDDILYLCAALKMPLGPGQTVNTHAVWVDEHLRMHVCPLEPLADILSGVVYGGQAPTPEDVAFARETHRLFCRVVGNRMNWLPYAWVRFVAPVGREARRLYEWTKG